MQDISRLRCPICEGTCDLLDVVDFNKSCEELRGAFLALAGVPVYYVLCGQCGFCFAPEFADWTLEDFSTRIYNSEYIQVDPDYVSARPEANADSLIELFGAGGKGVRHLDYGGGSGLLSDLLRDSGWQSKSFDPFVDRGVRIEDLGKFDLVTAYEVFEHVPDVKQLVSNISSLLDADGVLLFSTLLSDDNIRPRQRLTWWYASPRNGHISLFSRKSLSTIAAAERLQFTSFSSGFHAFWTNVPAWAAHITALSRQGVARA
jgi:SAM-dependent methyltransferase